MTIFWNVAFERKSSQSILKAKTVIYKNGWIKIQLLVCLQLYVVQEEWVKMVKE